MVLAAGGGEPRQVAEFADSETKSASQQAGCDARRRGGGQAGVQRQARPAARR